MINLIASLLEQLPLVAWAGEIPSVPSTLRYQRHQQLHITRHQRHIKRLQCGGENITELSYNFFFSRGHHRKSLGIEITMLEQAMVILLNILTRVLFRSCWLEVSPCFTLVQFGLVGEGKSLAIRVSFFESSSIALVSCSRSRGGAWGWGRWWWRPWPWCRPGPSRPSPSSSASPSTLMMLTQSSFSPWREPRFRSGGHQCHSCQVLVKINYMCLVFCCSPHIELNWS